MHALHLIVWGGDAFVLAAAVVWLLIPLAVRFGFVDQPAGRKDHAIPTPVTGGLGMLVAVLVCGAFMFDELGRGSLGFALAASMLVVMGLLDDRYDLPWWSRMAIQIAAALVLIYVGDVRIDRLGSMFGPDIPSMGVWSVPFTVFAIVGAINAVNMVDGADGLAGSLVLAGLVMLGIEAIWAGNASVYRYVPILIGAVAGFLLFNLRWPRRARARIFMGNSGSAFLGLVVACFVCRLTQAPQDPVDPVLALWLLPVPLIDCLVLMLRRVRHGHSPFSGDHNHVHYLMREAGFGPTRSALVLVVFSFACWGAVTLALSMGAQPVVCFAAFVVVCLLWYWTTSRRTRAVNLFRIVRVLSGGRALPVANPVGTEAP
jgi:UDP-GlcNAc:undecaprenyl-phosphate GlcNAc-1-phosphate transferase